MPGFILKEKYAVGMALAVKTLIVSAILISFYAYSDFDNVPNLWNRWYTGQDDVSSWYIPFANWDGQYYLLLSDWGYNYEETPDSPRAFFPLYPVLIHILSYVVPRMVAATLLSYLLTAGFLFFVQARRTFWLSEALSGYSDCAGISHRFFCFGFLYGGTFSVLAIGICLSSSGYQE